jgi:VanZ family protein
MYKIFSWIAVLLWMALIFHMSSQIAEQSNQLSTGIAEVIVKMVKKVAPLAEPDVAGFNHLIRKNAHFFSYFTLGLLVLYAFRRSGVSGYRSIALALGICILCAILDEVYQLFVPGRGGQVLDVCIDSAGAGMGMGLYGVMGRLVKRSKI